MVVKNRIDNAESAAQEQPEMVTQGMGSKEGKSKEEADENKRFQDIFVSRDSWMSIGRYGFPISSVGRALFLGMPTVNIWDSKR